jgi:hypothetical protein
MNRGSLASTDSSRASSASDAVRGLLAGAIDYAGLFPPAALDLTAALRNYAVYRAGDDSAMLGRFVVPAGRLHEVADTIAGTGTSGVRISAVLGLNAASDLEAVAAFNDRMPVAIALVDSIEAKTDNPDVIRDLASRTRGRFDVFVELPLDGELETLVGAVRDAGVRAKMRTGGVTAEAFPPSRAVVRFMRACLDHGVAFKATAGLHHPITGTYALTYAPDAPRGPMFGFLNVFLAAAFLGAGMSDTNAALLLDDRDASAFALSATGASWRGHHVDASQLAETHARAFGSFGSCSFDEPVDELRAMAFLP